MARTVAEVVDKARYFIQDRLVPYRNSDEELKSYVNDALQEIARLRPDVIRVEEGYSWCETIKGFGDEEIELENPIQVSDMWARLIAEYVAGSVALKDDEYVDPRKGNYFIEHFYRRLGASVPVAA